MLEISDRSEDEDQEEYLPHAGDYDIPEDLEIVGTVYSCSGLQVSGKADEDDGGKWGRISAF